jgi:large subunit ribosomal protein L9
MKVILLEDVERLGKRGALLNVADGYGRNFLIPKKLAAPATEANMKFAEAQSKKLKIQEAKEEKSATELKAELDQVSLVIPMKAGEGDVLFGSVTSANLAEALEQKGYSIDKRKIELEEPIKRLGDHQVKVHLHKNVSAHVRISVVKE